MFCPNCGSNVADGSNNCPNCGAALNAQQTQQQAYQQPQQQAQQMYQQPMMQPSVPGKGFGIASMVVGIIAIVCFCAWYISIPCGIVGAVLGGVAMQKAKLVGGKNRMAVAGLACSCVALGLTALVYLLAIAGLGSLASMF